MGESGPVSTRMHLGLREAHVEVTPGRSPCAVHGDDVGEGLQVTRPWASEQLPQGHRPQPRGTELQEEAPGPRRASGPDILLPHLGFCPAKRKWRQLGAGPGERARWAWRPHPHRQQPSPGGKSAAPAGGQCLLTSCAVCHHLCGQGKVTSVTPRRASPRLGRAASCGQTGAPASALWLGWFGLISPTIFMNYERKKARAPHFRVPQLRLQPAGSEPLRLAPHQTSVLTTSAPGASGAARGPMGGRGQEGEGQE